MVFYFTSNAAAAVYTIYMGKDKYENEDLIKYGWPEDVWFHVDKLSSAHVYLRLHQGQSMDDIPKEVLSDCAHLVKANSIQGCKLSSVTLLYPILPHFTPFFPIFPIFPCFHPILRLQAELSDHTLPHFIPFLAGFIPFSLFLPHFSPFPAGCKLSSVTMTVLYLILLHFVHFFPFFPIFTPFPAGCKLSSVTLVYPIFSHF
ncbi:coiled-coil domain-containing protein 25 isoform X3 [Agelaius tricolor]|uniref:coiled-coil domain-containing protein 25 isoform X3 n=1 Tax=Agelaius tricolor TaxID=9191 RepID=UPI0039F18F75